MNVYGASLLGSPVVNIGFNEHVGWTHTVTTAHHFTLYKLTLAPGDPTSYLYDGTPRAMTSQDFTIEVLGTDGKTTTETRTMYKSHYGPMISISQLGGWTTTTGYHVPQRQRGQLRARRAVAPDGRGQEPRRPPTTANEDVQGIPWVNTMAVDAGGTALYMDASRTPNLSDAALAALRRRARERRHHAGRQLAGCDAPRRERLEVRVARWGRARHRASCRSRSHRSSSAEDFVFNANDSYWLTNPAAPLTGYSLLFGQERDAAITAHAHERSSMLTEATTDGVSGADGKFTFDELSQVEFSDRESLAEVLLDQVVARCAGASSVTVDGSVGGRRRPPCGVLAAGIGGFNWTAWARCCGASSGSSRAVARQGQLFADAFDPDDPVATPKTLVAAPATGDDPVLVALAKAVKRLESAGLAASTKLGDAQHTDEGHDEIIPIHGGLDHEGAFNVVGLQRGQRDAACRRSRRAPVLERARRASPATVTS